MGAGWVPGGRFQLILNPIRDWNLGHFQENILEYPFQLILNPIRDWNNNRVNELLLRIEFQLILNPIRDWNRLEDLRETIAWMNVPINLKPY